MSDTKERLDRIRVMDNRIRHKDGTWSGEYFYEWSCGCRIYIPVFRDGSLGPGHRDEYCLEHCEKLRKRQLEGLRTCGS